MNAGPKSSFFTRAACWLVVCGALACGCGSPARRAWQSGIPGLGIDMQVAAVAERAGSLDVELVADGLALRSFSAASAKCRALLRPGRSVRWRLLGAWGRIEPAEAYGDAEASCNAIGIGNLALWRDRRGDPARGIAGPVPREQATYRAVHADARGFYVRGRFPLAARLGWTGTSDTIAVLPSTPACRSAAAAGVASLEYRSAGSRVLTLLAGDESCVVDGLLIPREF